MATNLCILMTKNSYMFVCFCFFLSVCVSAKREGEQTPEGETTNAYRSKLELQGTNTNNYHNIDQTILALMLINMLVFRGQYLLQPI